MLQRSGDLALYIRIDKNGNETYEVIFIKTAKSDWIIDGKVAVPAGKESYPASSTWGTNGWSFQTIEAAQKKYNKLDA